MTDPARDRRPETDTTGVALCLAGGGYSGALFEFGAVAALEAGLDGWSPERSSVIVGTSCGAVVGAVLAMGVGSDEIRSALGAGRRHPLFIRRRDFSRVPWGRHVRGWGRMLAALPRSIRGQVRGGRLSPADVLEDLLPHLPGGAFTNSGLADFVDRVARHCGREDRFDDLVVPLVLTATELDTGERAVHGPGWDVTPALSRAVRASAAIPVYFEPVRIGGRDLIDGQIIDPIHLDLAVRDDTRAVIAVSPLVPYSRGEGGSVTDIGAAAVMDQSGRIAAEVKFTRSRERFHAEHPDLPCLVVQPEPAEVERLLRTRFQQESMIEAWELGVRTATRFLTTEADTLGRALEPLGIRLVPGTLDRATRAWGVGSSAGD